MPIPGLDQQKCRQRNRIAARRDGLDTAPVTILATAPGPEGKVITTQGRLPADAKEALVLINALTPEGAEPLTKDDVYIHFAEAANDNLLPDRFMHLGEQTLRNIASGAGRGVSFMNSHRTGGFSTESELPFGKTVAGVYEEFQRPDGSVGQRAIVAFYMLRGIKPNGLAGPSTDDLHRQITGGTLTDVSVGVYGGERICDVCGHGLYDRDEEGDYLCNHVPGTKRAMNEEQIKAQQQRGVPDGKASYTLDDATFSEMSGVYDGAVPGAGFRKALLVARAGQLSVSELADCRVAYETLRTRTDFRPAEPEKEAVDVAALAEGLLALWGNDETDSAGEESLPTGLTFASHSDAVLTAVA